MFGTDMGRGQLLNPAEDLYAGKPELGAWSYVLGKEGQGAEVPWILL
jgi:hypothetical protein